MKRIASILAGVFLAVAPINGRAAPEPYVVPVIISLTGSNALIGSTQHTALLTLMKTVNEEGGINHRPLQFDFLDDASTAATTVQIVNRFINDKAPIIIGPSSVATCRAVAPLMTSGPVNYCMSTSGPIVKDGFSFDAGFSTFDSAQVALNYLRQRGWLRLALLIPTDSTGQDGEQSVNSALALGENRRFNVVAREHFGLSDISLAAQMAHIQAARPDVMIAWTTGSPLGTVLHALQYAGYDVPVLTSYGNLTYAEMGQFGDLAPKAGLYFPAPRFLAVDILRGADRRAVDRFIKAFDDVHVRPDAILATEWDVGLVVVDALRHAGPDWTADQLRRYIDQIRGLPGAAASFDFRESPQRGIAATTVVVGRWDPASKTFLAVSGPGGRPLTGR